MDQNPIEQTSQINQQFFSEQIQYKSFRIINKKTQQCLTDGPQVSCRTLSKTNVKQLWTFQKQKDNFISIISFSTGLVLTRNNNAQNLYCQKFKNKQNQLWNVQFCYEDKKQNQKYFWIIPKSNQEECLFATVRSSNLRLLNFDRTLFTSVWTIQEVDQNDKNFGFCQIRSTFTNLVLQAPDSSIKQDSLILQAKQQGKGTQKWIIQKLFNNYVIRNLCSGLVLSVGEQIKQNFQLFNLLGKQTKNCKKIIQQIFQNTKNQKWNLIKISQNQYYLQSEDDPQKFLGSLSNKQKVPVYLLNHQCFGEQMKNILWKIKGALPETAVKQKMLDIKVNIKKEQAQNT